MENRENKDKTESESEKNLADRLSQRLEKRKGSSLKDIRLGDRLSWREEETREKVKPVSDKGTEEFADFFDEITRLSDKYPELKDVKVSELKKAISKTGMTHPNEVIDKLRKKEYRTKLLEMEDEWITH